MPDRRLAGAIVLAAILGLAVLLAGSAQRSHAPRREGAAPHAADRSAPPQEPVDPMAGARIGPSFISGRAVDDRGQPVVGALVRAWWERPQPGRSLDAKTDAQGRFRVDGIEERGFSVIADAQGYLSLHTPGVLPGTSDLELVLVRAGTVRGTIVRSSDGQIIEHRRGAGMRRLDGTYGDTEFGLVPEGGAFEFKGVQPGRWRVEADADGYCPGSSEPFDVRPGETVEGILVRLPAGGIIQGTILSAKTGQPVPGATIERMVDPPQIFSPGDDPRRSESDPSGRFEMLLSPGRHRIRVRHAAFVEAVEVVQAQRETTAHVEIRLREGGRIAGTLTRLPGEHRSRFLWVVATAQSGGRQYGSEADASLAYTFEHLIPGKYTVEASDTDVLGCRIAQEVEVREGETTRCDVSFVAGWTVSGCVRAEGRPVDRVAIELFAGLTRTACTVTSSDGTYLLQGVPPGQYDVRISGWRGSLWIPGGSGSMQGDFDLPGGRLSCTIAIGECDDCVDYHGVFVLLRDGRPCFQGHVQASDSLTIVGLEPGSYEVKAYGVYVPQGQASLSVSATEESKITLTPQWPHSAVFRLWVRDAASTPVEGARVRLWETDGTEVMVDAMATGGGVLEWEGLPAGRYRGEVEWSGRKTRFDFEARGMGLDQADVQLP